MIRLRGFHLRGFAATVDKSLHAVALVITGLMIASPAFAQSRFEIGASATWTGGYDAGGTDATLSRGATGSAPLTLFGTSSQVQPAVGVIARVTFFATPQLALEGSAEYSRPTLETTILDDFEQAIGTQADIAISSFAFGGSVLYHFGAARFVPFASAGAAWMRQIDQDRVNLVTGAELHAGGGVKYRLSRHLALRVDAGVSSREKSIAFEDKRRTVPVIAAGLAYRF